MLFKKPGLREKLEVQAESERKAIEDLKDEELQKEAETLSKKGRPKKEEQNDGKE